jgi:signal transduction histidine kinase
MKGEGFVTKFGSVERESQDVIVMQASKFANSYILHDVLKGVPEAVIVVNSSRQIVFANQGVYKFLKPTIKALGLRPGEAFQCERALESWGGCGTTEFCRTCGAMRAMLNAQKGHADVQECRMSRGANLDPLDLRVWTTPIVHEGESFTVFAASDISNEKRRLVLEQIFFHDVLNVAGGVSGYAELLAEASADEREEFRAAIVHLSKSLVDEIKAQRELRRAENDELTPDPAVVEALSLLGDTVTSYRAHSVAQDRTIVVDASATEVQFISDPVLLRRVLGNMMKNALEASKPGGTVTIGCHELADGPEFWVHSNSFMPRSVQLQVFQRSFTTKGTGRGLGTYSMKLIGERFLDGQVSFETSLDDGTRFRIRLPHAPQIRAATPT